MDFKMMTKEQLNDKLDEKLAGFLESIQQNHGLFMMMCLVMTEIKSSDEDKTKVKFVARQAARKYQEFIKDIERDILKKFPEATHAEKKSENAGDRGLH